MPDQFAGDIAPNSTNRVTSPTSPSTAATFPPTTDPEAQQQQPTTPSLLDRIKLGIADTAKSFVLDMWLARQTPEKVLPRLLRVIAAARDEYADALEHGGGLYAVGYCFGARYALILAGGDPERHPSIAVDDGRNGGVGNGESEGLVSGAGSAIKSAFANLPAIPGLGGAAKNPGVEAADAEAQQQEPAIPPTDPSSTAPPSGPLIRAAAIAHGTLITRSDVLGVASTVPLCVIAVADDPLFPEEVLEVGRKAWAANGAECHVEVVEGVPHGFAVVGEYEDGLITREQERVWGVMRGWLDGH